MKKILITYCTLFSFILCQGQGNVDSLIQLLSITAADSDRVEVLIELSQAYRSIDPETGLKHAKEGLKVVASTQNEVQQVVLYNSTGILFRRLGHYDSAVYYLSKSIQVDISKEETAKAYNNLGLVYMDKGEYEESITYFLEAQKRYTALNHEKGVAGCAVNIGIINYQLGNKDKALEMYTQSIEVYHRLGEVGVEAIILNNMAVIYQDKKNYDKALTYFDESYRKYKEQSNEYGMATELGNLAVLYLYLKRYDDALEAALESIRVREKIGDQKGMSQGYNNVSGIYKHMNEMEKAFQFALKGLELAQELDAKDEVKSSLNQLANLYQETGDYKTSLEYFQQYMRIRDTIWNEQNQQLVSELEAKYESERKNKQIELLEKQDALNREKIAKQSLMEWGMAIGGLLLLCITILIYWKFAEGKKANQMIAKQKDIVERQNIDILDSIRYAKRIQTAIMPSHKLVKEYFSGSFVLYMPKDIVSGDFYWMEKRSHELLFAVVDCTGHGVPGAFMSLVGYNAITQAVKFGEGTKPSQILDRMNHLVRDTLSRTHEDLHVQDGMDISLCSLNFKTNILQFAGANNPLFVVRNGEMKEVRGDKMAVGPSMDGRQGEFTHHEIQLQKDDKIYITSDGFADQFGGAQNKKYNIRRLRKLFVNISSQPIEDQQKVLQHAFQEWKGEEDQVDDVCIIGLEV